MTFRESLFNKSICEKNLNYGPKLKEYQHQFWKSIKLLDESTIYYNNFT